MTLKSSLVFCHTHYIEFALLKNTSKLYYTIDFNTLVTIRDDSVLERAVLTNHILTPLTNGSHGLILICRWACFCYVMNYICSLLHADQYLVKWAFHLCNGVWWIMKCLGVEIWQHCWCRNQWISSFQNILLLL